ncbi:MAG: PQQ-binding-like beta-propeller repeat protein, partial [Armatimonadetes bacterium]|nr:PQQ-binding-like beta-propeller repeat protein [Armatimonadota bacterium]
FAPLLCAFAACALLTGASAEDAQPLAQRVLRESGVRGGLVVHLGCGDGKLTAALRANESYLVHGLDVDAGNVAKARAYLRSLGVSGPVSAEQWAGSRLPYADNTVNLAVVTGGGERVVMGELLRVLVPRGVAMVEKGGQWQKTVKPQHEGTDEWTHFLHDASGNPVANDQVVGPPRRLQWSEGPLHGRSHEHTPTVADVVSSGGRIFYLVDEAPVVSLLLPAQWQLVARDAYNGVLLWKRPLAEWWPRLAGWTQGPKQLQRRLVAIGDRVYVTLGMYAPLTALDAATGETVKVYDETAGAEEILWHNGALLLSVRSVTEERTTELRTWEKLSTEAKSPLYTRDTSTPLMQRLRGAENKADVSLLALDADTGRVLWRKAGEASAKLRPLSLCAIGDRALWQKANAVVCVGLKTGQELWSRSAMRLRVVCEGGVVCSDGKTALALSLQTGEPLWTRDLSLVDVRDVFIIGDSAWFGGFKPWTGTNQQNSNPVWGPYFVEQLDLATGELRDRIDSENPGHHHRCYTNKATSNYVLGGRRGTEFIDLAAGEVLWNSWARGTCMYGVMPANGLLYVPPHACGCYATVQMSGFSALAAAGKPPAVSDQRSASSRLERGPAYNSAPVLQSRITTDQSPDWPTYRHDAERSGATPVAVASDLSDKSALSEKWRTTLDGRLSAATSAEGKVFVAQVDQHTVHALDAATGKPAWSFTAGGRVDSPPTIFAGRVLFGGHDGYVYCLRAGDGALAWRFCAARLERRVVVGDRVESISPVHGSVLIRDGTAYVTAGRNSYLDGGIDLCRLNPETGEELSRTPIYSPDPQTDRQPPQDNQNAMPGTRSDLLTSDNDHVYLRHLVFSKTGDAQEESNAHLLSVTDFLDDTWPHRSYWIFGKHSSLATGCSGREKNLVYGRLLAFDGSTVFGYGRKTVHWSNQLEDGPYRVFSVSRSDGAAHWEKSVPIQVRAIVLVGKVLFVAGPPAEAGSLPGESVESQGALLLALSTADGTELGRRRLGATPVFDGMAAANGRLYVVTADGTLVCLAGS